MAAAKTASTLPAPIKVNQRVHALRELRAVPRGTTGKVLLIGGVSWLRYWVDFDNGVSMASIDRTDLATRDEWTAKKDATEVAAVADAGAGAAAAGEVESAGESVGGIPGHLLERSRKARERMVAKAG